MCRDCEAAIREVLSDRERIQLSNRKEVKVGSVDGQDVYFLDHSPSPALHIDHVAKVLHWLRDGHFVCGISSGTTAIKTLLSGKGKLDVNCSRCANSASEVWGVLLACPGVRRDQQSGLAPDPSSL